MARTEKVAGLASVPSPARDRTSGASAGPSAPGIPDVVRVDGKRLVIEGYDEIELRCGEATITLRRNGKIIISGARVETRSRGVNRIKGGSVKIN